MTTGHGATGIWLAVVAAGVGTFALRLSFIALIGRLSAVPAAVEGVLRFVPGAVLAALVASSVVSVTLAAGAGDGAGSTLALAYDPAKVAAGAVAAVVAWRTESVLATIAVGMAALWTIQALV